MTPEEADRLGRSPVWPTGYQSRLGLCVWPECSGLPQYPPFPLRAFCIDHWKMLRQKHDLLISDYIEGGLGIWAHILQAIVDDVLSEVPY